MTFVEWVMDYLQKEEIKARFFDSLEIDPDTAETTFVETHGMPSAAFDRGVQMTQWNVPTNGTEGE